MRRWAYVVVGIGGTVALASCSASRSSGNELVGQTEQAAGFVYQPQTTDRVCQLIGDVDFLSKPLIVPTKSQTFTNFGVRGTDEGYPIFDPFDQKIFFYFGDTNPDGHGYDVVGFTRDLTPPSDGCPTLQFGGFYSTNTQDPTQQPILTIDGQPRNIRQAPSGGFFGAVNGVGQIFLFYGVAPNGQTEVPNAAARAVLVTADPSTPNQLHSVFTSPFNADQGLLLPNGQVEFQNVAPILVSAATLSSTVPLPGLGPQDQVVLVYGSSGEFRMGAVYLAAVRLADIAKPEAYLYKSATGWTSNHNLSSPIIDERDLANPVGMGEMSVIFNQNFGVYLMANLGVPLTPSSSSDTGFVFSAPAFIELRSAPTPIGPWGPPTVILDQSRDQAIGRYLHDGNARATLNGNGKLVRTPGDVCTTDGTDICPGEPSSSTVLSCIGGLTVPPGRPWCLPPVSEDNVPTGPPGCCTNSNSCCDLAFTDTEANDNLTPWGSFSSGGLYAPYLIEPYSTATALLPGSSTPVQQKLYYTVSTWNPYVVDLMESTINNNDPDDDGIPTVDANGVPDDNCPLIFNPGQANCNSEAEFSWNATHSASQQTDVLGDACDPVPCPYAVVSAIASTNKSCLREDPYLTTVCEYREIHSEIDVSAVGSGVNVPTVVEQAFSPLHDDGNVPTNARFCQNVPGAAPEFPIVYCGDSSIESDAQLTAVPSDTAETFDPKHPWHRISLKKGPLESFRSDALLFSFDYGGAADSMTWDYAADDAFWKLKNPNVVGAGPNAQYVSCENPAFGAGTCLNGRIWLHGTSDVGSINPRAGDGDVVGLHGPGPGFENYYFDIRPDATTFEVIPGVGVLPRQRFIWRTLGDPPIGERVVADWQMFDRGNAIPILPFGAQILALRQSSALVDATSSFGPTFARELTVGGTWLNAPGPIGIELGHPMAVSLSADGTSIAATANLSGGRMLLARDVELIATQERVASADFGAPADVSVPSFLGVQLGNAGNGQATLSFRTLGVESSSTRAATSDARRGDRGDGVDHVSCLYRGGASTSHPTSADDRALGLRYNFVSCDNGLGSGAGVTATGAQLAIAGRDTQAGPTRVESALNALESGGRILPPAGDCDDTFRRAKGEPRPRHDFGATYAPTVNGVFVVGGESQWREHLSDVWFKPLDGPWQQVGVPTGVIGRVIDAAFSPADGRLWVIDEVDASARNVREWCGHGHPAIRLLRIERETGVLQVIASDIPNGRYDSRGLLVDRDGQILVYASSERANTHAVARLVPDANTFDVSLAAGLSRALVAPPVVDPRGYSFVEAPTQGSPHAFNLERASSLPFSPANLDAWTQLLQ